MTARLLPSRPDRRGVLGAAAAAAGALAFPAIARAAEAVNLQLSWLISGNQLGEIVAQRQGYYAAEGLNLTLQPGGPTNNGVSITASGKFEIGSISGTANLMLAAAQGIPIKAFAVGLQKHPFVFLSRADKPARNAAELRGKKVGLTITSVIQLRGVLAKNGIDEKEVEIVRIGNDLTPLVTGQVDVVSSWLTNTTAIRALGPNVVAFTLWDAGVRLYANAYYATHKVLESRADMLARFARATARGWTEALERPDEAVRLLVAAVPNTVYEDERRAAEVMLSHSFTEATRGGGWGDMTVERWEEQIGLMADLGQLPRRPRFEEVATLDILARSRDGRPKRG